MRLALFLASSFFVAILATVIASSALAAGYSCLSVDRDTRVDIFMDAPGSGRAEKIVFMDPTLTPRSQVIVEFSSADAQINSEPLSSGVRFVSTFSEDLDHPGKRLAGTKIGLLSAVSIEIQTATAHKKFQCLSEGSVYASDVSYLKKDGEILKQEFDCTLFLGDVAPALNLDN
jgi:hypothetical protein